ncbi:MAG: hypothetical protein H6618_07265 [Deltaproteobacteria bacterium]|nr:hypothetical protein [Deltaproteobacteria bacterium]
MIKGDIPETEEIAASDLPVRRGRFYLYILFILLFTGFLLVDWLQSSG